jgi:subtilisin family serine protease
VSVKSVIAAHSIQNILVEAQMAARRVMIEIRTTPVERTLYAAAMTTAGPNLSEFLGLEVDSSFGRVPMPPRGAVEYSVTPKTLEARVAAVGLEAVEVEQTYIVRGTMTDEQMPSLAAAVVDPANPVVGIFADVPIHPFITCGNSPAVGTDKTVEDLLCVPRMQSEGMTGEGVMVAVVDTGINLAFLNTQGKHPNVNPALSWMPRPGLVPFNVPVNHGTMCAFDICIAAPKCTLLDIGVLLSQAPGGTVMEGLLSDAVRAYSHLRTILKMPQRPKALVVSNSWGMFNPSWDYPVGHPGNYSDNPNHPFNRIVGTLEREGADILFAAGNCGDECPDGRCGGVTDSIYGANSHPQVLCIAGVDTQQNRVGYSTKGPGRLTHDKPDLSGYTHFKGSGVYPVDSGTSAATPVVAGVIAALRTRFPFQPLSPATWPRRVRELVERSAIDRGVPGYDLEYGWGIVDGCKLANLDQTSLSETGDTEATGEHVAVGPTGPSTQVSHGVVTDAGVKTAFIRLSADAQPGRNVHFLTGLPAGTRAISIWVTEWRDGNMPGISDAVMSTSSVQLFNNGRQCRFVFDSSATSSLPVAAQIIFGSP